MSNHIAELGIVATGAVAYKLQIENPQHAVFAWCLFSGVLCGYAGSIFLPIKGIKMSARWCSSVVLAVVFGPVASTFAQQKFPNLYPEHVTVVASGLCAIFGVLILILSAKLLTQKNIQAIIFALLPPAFSRLFTNDNKTHGRDGDGN